MIITVKPVKRGKFVAYIGEHQMCRPTFTPFLAAARTLANEGADLNIDIVMRHEGSDTNAMVSTIGQAAALSVKESPTVHFRPFEPFDRGALVSGSSKDASV